MLPLVVTIFGKRNKQSGTITTKLTCSFSLVDHWNSCYRLLHALGTALVCITVTSHHSIPSELVAGTKQGRRGSHYVVDLPDFIIKYWWCKSVQFVIPYQTSMIARVVHCTFYYSGCDFHHSTFFLLEYSTFRVHPKVIVKWKFNPLGI